MKHSVKEVTLKNGSKGLIINVPSATVMTYDISFRAGDAFCDPEKWETAHLMEHLALGANQEYRSGRKFNAVLEQNGAYSNASTNAHDITYEAECADFEWDRVLELMLVAIGKPLFLESEFKAEFSNVREELIQRANNHASQLSLDMGKKFGYKWQTWQERQRLLKNVTLEDVKSHYKKTHFTKNMRFVVAGNIDSQKRANIVHKLEKLALPEGTENRYAMPDETPKKIKPVYIENKTVPNLYFDIDTFKVGGRLSESEILALILVSNILTGTLHSRLLGKAREKGLVYGMGSGWHWAKNDTGWGIGAQVSRENAPALFDLIAREIKRILAGKLDPADLKAAKDYTIGSHQRSGQTVNSIVNQYRGYYFGDDTVTNYDNFVDGVKAVTRPRAIAAFKKMFEDDVWGIGFLGTVTKAERDLLHDKIASIWR